MDNIDYGIRAKLLADALRRAQEDQNQTIEPIRQVGGFAIGPSNIFSSGVKQALGHYSAGHREKELTALNDEQMGKFAEIAQQLNQPGSVDYNDPAAMNADNARRMGLASHMSQLSLPQAQKVAQDYLAKGASFPDTMAQLKAKQIEAGQQAAMRLQEQARIEADREEGRNQRAADANALRMTLKQMGSGGGGGGSPQIAFINTVDEQGNSVIQAVDKRQVAPGTQFGKAPSSAERKAIAEANIGIAGIDDALEKVKASGPKSFGLQYAVPGAETAGQYLDKEGISARAAVANVGSLKLHDRSGATVTANEFPRLAPFIPKVSDSKEAITQKLNSFKQEYGRIAQEWGRDPATKPKSTAPAKEAISDQDLLNKYK